MKAPEGATLNFTVNDIRRSLWYDIVVRYESPQPGVWQDVEIIVVRDGPTDPNGPCANLRPEDDHLWVQLPHEERSAVADPAVCLEAGKTYTVLVEFRKFDSHADTPTAAIVVDSVSSSISETDK